jgi:predicted ester cyclase
MTAEENKELLRRGYIAWATFDEETFVACTAPTWRDLDGAGNEVDNRDNAVANMRRHRVAFPDQRLEFHDILGDGELVATFCTLTATHTGKYFDVEPTGRAVRSHSLAIHRVVDGQVVESRTMYDGPGFLAQLKR